MEREFLTVAAPMSAANIIIAMAAAQGPATLSHTALADCTRAGEPWLLISGMVSSDFAAALVSPETLRAALVPVMSLSEAEAVELWEQIDASSEGDAAVADRLGLVLTPPLESDV
ncbi:MAG: hypothetical protein WCZ20_01350 [Hydrogenophaga sp.]|nr:hypothetical protein [Ottowia sp.]